MTRWVWVGKNFFQLFFLFSLTNETQQVTLLASPTTSEVFNDFRFEQTYFPTAPQRAFLLCRQSSHQQVCIHGYSDLEFSNSISETAQFEMLYNPEFFAKLSDEHKQGVLIRPEFLSHLWSRHA